MHLRRLPGDWLPRIKIKAAAQFPRFTKETICPFLPLTLVTKVVAMPAKEVLPTCIKLGHPPATFWANEPGTPSAKMARRPGKSNYVMDRFPITIPRLRVIAEKNSIPGRGNDPYTAVFLLPLVRPPDRPVTGAKCPETIEAVDIQVQTLLNSPLGQLRLRTILSKSFVNVLLCPR